MGEIRQYIGVTPCNPLDDPVIMYIYEGKDGTFTLYEDDGVTKEYVEGGATYTTFTWDDEAGSLSVVGRSSQITGKTRAFKVVRVPSGKTSEISCRYREL